jgi:hypothetical protein
VRSPISKPSDGARLSFSQIISALNVASSESMAGCQRAPNQALAKSPVHPRAQSAGW